MVKILIQCAGSKDPTATSFQGLDGQSVLFVSKPEYAPKGDGFRYAHPDDKSDTGESWRDLVTDHNEAPPTQGPLLSCAIDLYENPAYRQLKSKYSAKQLYILSAGWGLVRSDFRIPTYDITFSYQSSEFNHRSRDQVFLDYMQLSDDEDDIVVFSGKSYLPFLGKLTKRIRSRIVVYYNSSSIPDIDGLYFRHYQTDKRTNWHYECAMAFIQGKISL